MDTFSDPSELNRFGGHNNIPQQGELCSGTQPLSTPTNARQSFCQGIQNQLQAVDLQDLDDSQMMETQ
jgi:hypothetical protein